MPGAAAAERQQMPARFEYARHRPPRVGIKRDTRRIPRLVHESAASADTRPTSRRIDFQRRRPGPTPLTGGEVIRRVGQYGINTVGFEFGQNGTAVTGINGNQVVDMVRVSHRAPPSWWLHPVECARNSNGPRCARV
jgi:hypothetical protein